MAEYQIAVAKGEMALTTMIGRGRDTSYPVPPAQIPASGTTAPGSYLELWRAKKRSSGQGCRTLGCGSQRVTWRCIFFQVSFRL